MPISSIFLTDGIKRLSHDLTPSNLTARHARVAVTSRHTPRVPYSRRCERYRIDRSRGDKYIHATTDGRRRHARAAHARTMPTTMRARAVTPSRATTRATTKKRTDATRRVARATTTTTRAVRDGDEVRDEGRAPWVTRVPMGREARRARGGRGRRARRWCGAREIRARDRRARGGWATSRGCGYRWMKE